jgi:PAS domain S-box-containing protein
MITRDLTEQRLAEQRFRAAVESSPTAMVMVDATGTIALFNAATETLFGYERHELHGRPVELLLPELLRDSHRSMREAYFSEPTARPMGAGRDLFACRKDGSEFPVEIGLNPLVTDQGLFVMSSIVDISARRAASERLEGYARRLEKSNSDLEEFAYVVSHDLKAPLRGIASVATWLSEDLEGRLTQDQGENVGLMLERTQRLSNMIDGILDYSRVGRQQRTLTRVDAHALATRTIASMSIPAGIDARIEGRLPSVHYDATQLEQVLQNLVANGVDHMGRTDGEIVLSSERGSDEWVIAVRDTGTGIPERHLERIFRLFQTLHSKDDVQSTGIGLSIVKRIVEDAGGRVWVESTPGEGSVFRFSIPDSRDDEIRGTGR